MTLDHVRIFDTTLRDGEQSPGCDMSLDEKLAVARQLAVLGESGRRQHGGRHGAYRKGARRSRTRAASKSGAASTSTASTSPTTK